MVEGFDELPGLSVFYLDENGEVYHTYSSYARGNEEAIGAFIYLDITPNGRNEREIMDWVRRHDEYEDVRRMAPAVATKLDAKQRIDPLKPNQWNMTHAAQAENHPILWFDGKAEEAMNLYVSKFKNSKIASVTRSGDAGPWAKGNGYFRHIPARWAEFIALNGGPRFKVMEAISLFVNCETQEEVDDLLEKLAATGEKQRCGWLKDKFGLSWQIIPSILGELLHDKDPEKSKRVVDAMLQMDKSAPQLK